MMWSLSNIPNIGIWHIFRVVNIKIRFSGQKLNSGPKNGQKMSKIEHKDVFAYIVKDVGLAASGAFNTPGIVLV